MSERGKASSGAVKQVPLRLEPELYEELARRSAIEQKSMNTIVREALRAQFDTVRITKSQLHAAITRIARDDSEILAKLAGPETENTDECKAVLSRA